jgi:hypothetical protein
MSRSACRLTYVLFLSVILGVVAANDAVVYETSGAGDSVIRVNLSAPALVRMTHSGRSNFAVIAYDGQGQPELLVNTIGSYRGTRPVGMWGTLPTEIVINADGTWTFALLSLSGAEPVGSSGQGLGDAVLRIGTAQSPSRIASIAHNGSSNFAVIAWGAGPSLLVNHIGTYQGTVRVPPGTVYLEISADGGWAINID